MLGGLSGIFYNMVIGFIQPNLPALFLLLAFSTLFSTINFLGDLHENSRFSRKAICYLFLWVGVNYIFALIFLLLIMPKDVSLGSFSRNLFVYCLIATGLPELSANLRIQLGRQSEKALVDLRQYKKKVSDFISQQLTRASIQDRERQLRNLVAYYTGVGRLSKFRTKLKACMANCDLNPESRKILNEISDELETGSQGEKDAQDVLFDAFVKYPENVPYILEMFRDDIEDFEKSPVSRLMLHMHPLVTVQEAREMVKCRITSPGRFLLRTMCRFQRVKLAERLKDAVPDISEDRISEIRNITRSARKRRNSLRLRWSVVVLTVVFLSFVFFSSVGYRHQYTYNYSPAVVGDAVMQLDQNDLSSLAEGSRMLSFEKVPNTVGEKQQVTSADESEISKGGAK